MVIIGISCVIFGLINLFSYFPILSSPSFLNTPFPFEEIQSIDKSEDDQGITMITVNHSFESALQLSPYWFVWSMIFYAGIGMTSFAIWRKRR